MTDNIINKLKLINLSFFLVYQFIQGKYYQMTLTAFHQQNFMITKTQPQTWFLIPFMNYIILYSHR